MSTGVAYSSQIRKTGKRKRRTGHLRNRRKKTGRERQRKKL